MAYRIDPQTGRLIPDGMPFNYPLPQMPPQPPPQAPPEPQGQPLMAGMPQVIQMPEFRMAEADKQQALRQALMAAGSSIMSNMGPSRMPVSGAQILGQAGLAGMQGYQGAQDKAMDRFKEFTQAQQAGRSPYFSPVQTSQGFYGMDARTGTISPLKNEAGTHLMPISADVNLAGRKETVVKTADENVKKRFSYPKIRNTHNSLNRQWGNVETSIQKAITMVSPFTAGLGAWTKAVPATPAKDLEQVLEMIKANIGFDKLQDMRSNSPTGGALGQVSDFENKLLQAVQGSMDQSQTPAQLKENLQNVLNNLKLLKEYNAWAMQQDYGTFMQEDKKKVPPTSGGAGKVDLNQFFK